MSVRRVSLAVAFLTAWSCALYADEEETLKNEVTQLRAALAPIFSNVNMGMVQGKAWISGVTLEKAVASIDPLTLTFTQRGASVPSTGGTPQPAPNVIPIQGVTLLGGVCTVTVGIPQTTLTGTLKTLSPTGDWQYPQPGSAPPLEIRMKATLEAGGALGVYLSGTYCPNIQLASPRIHLALSTTAEIGATVYRDPAERSKYRISYLGPEELHGSFSITGVPVPGLSNAAVTLKIAPRVLWDSRLDDTFRDTGVLKVKGLPQKPYSLQLAVKDVVHATDGVELVYQVHLNWGQ